MGSLSAKNAIEKFSCLGTFKAITWLLQQNTNFPFMTGSYLRTRTVPVTNFSPGIILNILPPSISMADNACK